MSHFRESLFYSVKQFPLVKPVQGRKGPFVIGEGSTRRSKGDGPKRKMVLGNI